jgi:hypothetical protein
LSLQKARPDDDKSIDSNVLSSEDTDTLTKNLLGRNAGEQKVRRDTRKRRMR